MRADSSPGWTPSWDGLLETGDEPNRPVREGHGGHRGRPETITSSGHMSVGPMLSGHMSSRTASSGDGQSGTTRPTPVGRHLARGPGTARPGVGPVAEPGRHRRPEAPGGFWADDLDRVPSDVEHTSPDQQAWAAAADGHWTDDAGPGPHIGRPGVFPAPDHRQGSRNDASDDDGAWFHDAGPGSHIVRRAVFPTPDHRQGSRSDASDDDGAWFHDAGPGPHIDRRGASAVPDRRQGCQNDTADDHRTGSHDAASRPTALRDSVFADTARGSGGGGVDDRTAPIDDPDEDPDDPVPGRWRARRIRRGSWGRLAERWVPEPLREARVDPGRRGAVVFVSVALIAGLAAAVAVWTTGPSPQPVAATVLAPVTDAVTATGDGGGTAAGDASRTPGAAASGTAPVSPSTAAGTSTTEPAEDGSVAAGSARGSAAGMPQQEIIVSVTGRVITPGLVTLPPESRVADAVAAAGGPTAEADLTGLNLAARLADGDSVVIAGAGEPAAAGVSRLAPGASSTSASDGGTPTGGTSTGVLLDLNTADQAALEDLPGVGPVMAQAILTWRAEHGTFTDVAQLQEVSGIGPARYAQLQPLVTV